MKWVTLVDPLKVVEHKSEKRQNAPFSFIAFIICSASQNIVSKRVIVPA